MANKAEPKARKPSPRDEKGRFVSPINGQPLPKGRPFVTGDSRAREAQRRGVESRREKADLRRQAMAWMEADVGKDKDGKPMTGAQMMIKVAAKEISKGNPRFWELLRDTAGFKPVDKVMVAEIDPEVIDEVEKLVEEAGHD